VTEPVTYDAPQPNAALVVGPDDVLVISLPGFVEPDDWQRLKDGLLPALAGRVQFVVGAEISVVLGDAPSVPVESHHSGDRQPPPG
jgi:hypothetical protein